MVSRRLFSRFALAFLGTGIVLQTGALRGDVPLVQVDSSFVVQDAGGWTIGNEFIRYSLARQGAVVGVRAVEDVVTGRDWHTAGAPDSFVTLNGQRLEIGSSATAFQSATARAWWGGSRLDLTYRIASASIELTRSYACYPGSSIIETWTTFRATGSRAATLSDLTNFTLTISNGTVRWIGGADVADEQGGAFTLGARDLNDGQVFEIGSSRRASETSMPWFAVSAWTSSVEAEQPDRARTITQFFGAMMWSGSWRAQVRRSGGNALVQLGLPGFTTALAAGASLEGPHAVFGVTNEQLPSTSAAIRSFVDLGIRHGRPLRALVTYNTWFPYGTFLDEGSLRAEMNLAAQMGFEQFVVDAGWWPHIDSGDNSDYARGWGSWEVDEERFPSGLGALTDYAHQLGLRFGVWVEPERVDLATVGLPGLAKERFLATEGGRYDQSAANSQAISAQICLVDPEAKAWALDKLHDFLDAVHPDYVKWDNNFWINCDRPTHGHGAGDGNFRHLRGLADVLTDLRARYPDMDIENCASGGHRMSLDLLAYTDAAWVDDRSAPSSRVRHNLEGLSKIFPASYLFTFVMPGENESMFDEPPTADVLSMARSRMSGILGAAWLGAEMTEGTQRQLAKQIALYKLIRPILQDGGSVLLSDQIVNPRDASWSGWDVIEHFSPRTGDAVVLAFNSADGPESALVKLRGLRPDARYDVESADYGPLGTATGAELMDDGLQIDVSAISQSHVLLLRLHVE